MRFNQNKLFRLSLFILLIPVYGNCSFDFKGSFYQKLSYQLDNLYLEDGQVYYLETIVSDEEILEIRLVEKLKYPYQTIIVKYHQNPIKGAKLDIINPFKEKLIVQAKIKYGPHTGYSSIFFPSITDRLVKIWTQNVFGLMISGFEIMKLKD